ncbi:ATPase, P-type (transporting), HAD superfamily, subfamily IC [Coriobacterium glomerans PW2]|uniref:Probable cation-transporting ATPase F n=1 Tax=Coriobacterium glomerans (strain ATCC 49209 / DSM 20642 / JCM 10262 / PW2) TaxID=700015 RepID=F2NA60_CORGP|nr:cation-translocating P-type ATPase [Coriobacterium glomerans]AEB06454.1 ATPase, P-type (transporting), HAD superfamily, subfamily IC [Coriobacterium glomerans PW2]
MKREYLASTEEVLSELSSDERDGLAEKAARERMEQVGPNRLEKDSGDPLWRRFIAQMADPMILLLLAAAIISALTGAVQGGEGIADVAIILFVVVVNAVLGVVQQTKAEAALDALQQMSADQSRVVREGALRELPSADLVPGDIVLLEAGDSIPADARVLESASLKIEESALTGESLPQTKGIEPLSPVSGDDDISLGDRTNMVYMGSAVVYGRGRAVVTATGMDTEMGRIAGALTTAKKEQTPLQIKLAQLSRILTGMVIAICAVIVVVDLVRHGAQLLSHPALMINTFMVAVSLAVAAIPEGLVAVVTIVLSIGVTKMSRRHAIIRRLTAVETLGSTQIICTDKTGTLTQNRMSVVEHELEGPQDLHLRAMALCSDAVWDAEAGEATGEPTESALVNDAAEHGFYRSGQARRYQRVAEVPFDSARKMMSVVVQTPDGRFEQYTKGAPDEILKRCTRVMRADGSSTEMSAACRDSILARNKSMADRALRVLAVAVRFHAERPAADEVDALERDLAFVGLSGMIDPIRPEVADAIAEAKGAGMRPVMITGDHIDTAIAIARDLKIIDSKLEALTGSQLSRMSDADLREQVTRYSVYARVQPEHKTRIVRAWQSRHRVVAMTGDGVNDAPSIKRADIGIGMGITGTDVTKNVADMVLADDNFATIVSAVEEGRRIYDNIRKVIQFLLSANLAEVFSVFFATMIGFTIFQPVQLLWINLITDCAPALALGMEPAEGDVMKRRPRSANDGVFADGMGLDCIVQGIVITALVVVSFFIGSYLEVGTLDWAAMIDGHAALEGTTMAFITLSMVEIFHSFNMRSRRASILGFPNRNPWLWASAVLALALTSAVVEIGPLAEVFGFRELSVETYGIALLLAVLIIPAMELYKAIMRRQKRRG